MARRFYAATPILGRQSELSGSEAQHLTRVLRLGVGAAVTLFDGSGREWAGQISQVERGRVMVDLGPPAEVNREATRPTTLAVALPKGDRQRWLVEKATELGVYRLIPLVTHRSVAQPRPQTLERLRRTVVEACKQCGRNRLMAIGEPQTFEALLADARHPPPDELTCRLFADPQGTPWSQLPADWLDTARPSVMAIGPEGGFSDEERVAAAKQGWQAVSLGPRILRVETAALFVAARLCA